MTSTNEEVVVEMKREDPPPKRQPVVADWTKIVKKAKRSPGKWYVVFKDGPTSTTTAVKSGGIAAIRPVEDFEFRTANNKRGTPRTCDFYLRYVGHEKKED